VIRLFTSAVGLIALVGCAPDIQFETASSGLENGLEQELAGVWRVEGVLHTDCPDGWRRRMPAGETRWVAQEGQLIIEPLTGDSETVTLWPMDERLLFNRATVTVQDCGITETLLLDIHSLQGRWASGIYEATLEHDGSAQCDTLATEAKLPNQCTTHFEWQARRR